MIYLYIDIYNHFSSLSYIFNGWHIKWHLYISSHIYIVYNISSFDHAIAELNAGIPTGCNSFSWSFFAQQPFTIALFVCSSLSQQTHTTIHSHIYLSREHGQTKEKSWCCMHALSQPVAYYFREASEKIIIVVRFFVRLYSPLSYPIYFLRPSIRCDERANKCIRF